MHKRKPTAVTRRNEAKKRRITTNMSIPNPLRTNVVRNGLDIGKGPIAARCFVWMKYNEPQVSGAANYDRVYNANSISDPDETGGGHRPLGYAQYKTFYNRFRVWGVRATVTFAAKPSVTSSTFKVALACNNSISLATSWDTAAEQQDFLTKPQSPQGLPVVLRKYYNIRKIVGQTLEQYRNDDRFQAIFDSHPTERVGLHIMHATLLGGLAGDTVMDYNVLLEYRVELFDPHILAGSTI